MLASTLYTYTLHFLHFVAGASGTTDLTLEAEDYDTSPDASVGAWCLLEAEKAEDVETAEEAEARVTGLEEMDED